MGGATTQLVTSAVRPGGTVLIYGALSGPTLTLNTFDIFLRKRLEACAGSGSGSQLWLHEWQAWPHAWLSCLLGEQPKAVTLPAGRQAAGRVTPMRCRRHAFSGVGALLAFRGHAGMRDMGC